MTPHTDTKFVLGDPARLAPSVPQGGSVLDRNLAALARSNPELSMTLRRIPARESVEFVETQDGAWSAIVDGRALASKRRPLDEAERLIETVDVREAAILAVLGFGMGHHLAALASKLGRTGIILCYEPDLALVRAVLERVDHSAWIAKTNFAIVSEAGDAATLSTVLHGFEGLVAMGVKIVEHPPSAARLGETSTKFGQTLTDVVSAIRTNVVTTLVQTETTVRNLLMNADRYVCAPGIGDLRNRYENRPAVVVSAGPSLARNMNLLARPGVRERCCIIAVQTALKPLLSAGIRPHFVVALDYHEISRRFYEGLTAADVEGVTLVAEPKANPAILDAWPGELRMPADTFLDAVLGADLADRERGAIRAGATVAHLAHYLARHLGCDPVALIGQDLAFSEHQYYAAGAAIHDVWAGELNEFVSLELLEWQRIARHKGILRKATDQQGRAIYTDEQMATYLAQFERDFLADVQSGLMVVDATEGGVRKANASPMPLAEFLRIYAGPGAPSLPSTAPPARPGVGRTLAAAMERMREVRQGVWNVARLCRQTETLLAQMSEHIEDQQRVNRLIGQTEQMAKEVAKIQPGYALAQRYNQMGVFNRSREDRAIMLEDLSPVERQRRQIERDQRNVRWLAEATDRLGVTLDAACRALRGGEKITRDLSMPSKAEREDRSGASRRSTGVGAVLLADTRRGSLGAERDLLAPIHASNALRMTVERLARCERLDGIAVLTDDPDRVRTALQGVRAPYPIGVERVDLGATRESMRPVRTARLWSRDCWRAGLAGISIFDEVVDPALASGALRSLGLRAALIVGADWAFVDPALCDAVIARHEESPESHRLVFTQASPGLCGCVVDEALLREIAEKRTPGASQASIGALLAYNPRKPKADPIAKPICVSVDARVRDAQARFVCDDALGVARANAVAAALAARGHDPRSASAVEVVGAWDTVSKGQIEPHTVTLRVGERTTPAMIADALDGLAGGATLAVTIDARGVADGAMLARFAIAARDAGASGVHLRHDLRAGAGDARAILAANPDVVSVDMHADSREAYEAITGQDGFASALEGLETLAKAATPAPWARLPWIVPRMTKLDATHDEIESFVDKWTLVFGHAAIDAAEIPDAHARVRPLPLPRSARARLERTTRVIDLRRGTAR